MIKEPRTFKRPRLYFQEGNRREPSRIRIIYPNGNSEWLSCHLAEHQGREMIYSPCWARGREYVNGEPLYYRRMGKDRTAREALKNMRKYDRSRGFQKAKFLGEL